MIMKNQCNFAVDTTIVKMTLNQLKIYIQINSLKHFMKSMLDFQFVLSLHVKSLLNILKIIIFMNFIMFIKKTCALM